MSNFICSECGMANIDCGCAGYKTPKEIELEKKLEIATKALEEISDLLGNCDDYGALCCATNALQEMEGVK